MTECEPAEKAAMVLAACDRLHNSSGGASDTELKELAVRPISSPVEVRAVTMVTPVVNMASEARNSRCEKLGSLAFCAAFFAGDNILGIWVKYVAAHQVGMDAKEQSLIVPDSA